MMGWIRTHRWPQRRQRGGKRDPGLGRGLVRAGHWDARTPAGDPARAGAPPAGLGASVSGAGVWKEAVRPGDGPRPFRTAPCGFSR